MLKALATDALAPTSTDLGTSRLPLKPMKYSNVARQTTYAARP